ncbi:MAG: hypothetical protein APF84_10355 [Gracilibacter sp. BRH_c7a]|nr:MAG: hypothetical protein APF84_10355 [Gracilibacter sp. BRH_c7a]
MEIIITKALSNARFVSGKQEKLLAQFAKRLWLPEEIPVVSDGSVVYRLVFAGGTAVEGRITGTGVDEQGFYIVFKLHSFSLNNDILLLEHKRLPRGRAILSEVFNPHTDKTFRALTDERYMGQYFFHGAFMRSSRTANGMVLEFELGALSDRAFRIELSGIAAENCVSESGGGLETFAGGRIREVFFRKNESGEYQITIDNTYNDFIFSKGTNCFSPPVKPKIVKHINYFTIRCRDLKVRQSNYFIDTLKKNGIECIELHHNREENMTETLRQRWKQAFLQGVDVENIYLDQCLWHVFSYNRLKSLTGEEASARLDSVGSSTLYVFLDNARINGPDICYRLENAASFSHKMLSCYKDVYVMDENFSWTYVRTHEERSCGPYFYHVNIKK